MYFEVDIILSAPTGSSSSSAFRLFFCYMQSLYEKYAIPCCITVTHSGYLNYVQQLVPYRYRIRNLFFSIIRLVHIQTSNIGIFEKLK